MATRPVQLQVGGQTYRVVSSASEVELERLAALVDDKLAALAPPGRPVTPQLMLLAAMALAHDVEMHRLRAERIRGKSKAAIAELLERVDGALAVADESLAAGATGEQPRA